MKCPLKSIIPENKKNIAENKKAINELTLCLTID